MFFLREAKLLSFLSLNRFIISVMKVLQVDDFLVFVAHKITHSPDFSNTDFIMTHFLRKLRMTYIFRPNHILLYINNLYIRSFKIYMIKTLLGNGIPV